MLLAKHLYNQVLNTKNLSMSLDSIMYLSSLQQIYLQFCSDTLQVTMFVYPFFSELQLLSISLIYFFLFLSLVSLLPFFYYPGREGTPDSNLYCTLAPRFAFKSLITLKFIVDWFVLTLSKLFNEQFHSTRRGNFDYDNLGLH